MFGRHVTKELSAYAHGELADAATARTAAHLLACARCRADFEEIKFGIRLAENLPPRPAPAHLWEAVEAALDATPSPATPPDATTAHTHAHARDSLTRRTNEARRDGARAAGAKGRSFGVEGRWFSRRGRLFGRQGRLLGVGWLTGWRLIFVACAPLLLALAGVVASFWLRPFAAGRAWEVASVAGTPTVGSARVSKSGRLAVGDWLETDANSRAELSVANIGRVEVEPRTRLRLVETKPTEHRVELARGRVSAHIWAPPRLFFVDTPSAVAADLGCAYTLEVDDAGRGLLHVDSGWVALEAGERESLVPTGASCRTQPGAGPGTPYFPDATPAFIDALARFDFARGGAGALSDLLRESRPRDTLTLWHLLARTEGPDRVRVYERLAQFAPPPAGVTRNGALSLDPRMMQQWKGTLEDKCFDVKCGYARGAWHNFRGWLRKVTGE